MTTYTGSAARPTRPDDAPLILTLRLAAADQAYFDRLRQAHFPPERNFLQAHVTLFHHLPGAQVGAILEALPGLGAPFAVSVTGLRSLGRGVAFTLQSAALGDLRGQLARRWWDWLGAQDRQAFHPHVTVQNKVTPGAARALLGNLSAGFTPFSVTATGLSLWWYRGGPWEAAGEVAFRSPGVGSAAL